MTNFNFRSLLLRSARLVISIRGLVLFGFVAAVIGGGGELDFVLRNYERVLDFLFTLAISGFAAIRVLFVAFVQGVATAFGQNTLLASLALLLWLGASLGVLWLLFTSQAVLIEVPALAEQKKRFTWSMVIRHANSNYWSFLGLYLLRLLVTWLPFIILASLAALIFPTQVDRIGYFLFFLLFMPVAFITGFLNKFVIAGLVVSDLPFWRAVTNALKIFTASWLATIEFAILLLVAGVLLFTLVSFLAIIILIPFLLLSGVMAAYLSLMAATLIKTAGVIIFFLLLLTAGLFFAAFEHVGWSLFYLAATEGGVESKLVRLFRRS